MEGHQERFRDTGARVVGFSESACWLPETRRRNNFSQLLRRSIRTSGKRWSFTTSIVNGAAAVGIQRGYVAVHGVVKLDEDSASVTTVGERIGLEVVAANFLDRRCLG